ncbi:MAG TPA: stage II sporulation protein D [Symbiobacteriaceae bacterium]|jgi:stage II sporulation protein D
MRRILVAGVLLLALVLVVLPAAVGRLMAHPAAARPPENLVEAAKSVDALITVKVYFPEKRLVQEMPLDEYLKGVVVGEMPSDFATEALKAQMVVARTFVLRRMRQFAGAAAAGCPLNPQADVCADPNTGQAYMSRDQANARLGYFATTSLWHRLDGVQKATDGLVIRYHGELIDPLYHSVSGGFTEDAGDYFSHSVPYLKSVDDHWGADAPKLNDSVTYAPEELVRRLSAGGREIAVAAVAASARSGKVPVQITARTGTGRVKALTVGGAVFSGKEFREKLGLRSADFAVTVKSGAITISTHGYGHGVGMSQYGANGMARASKDFREILTHYYQDVNVVALYGE